jgi:hypothetical protein
MMEIVPKIVDRHLFYGERCINSRCSATACNQLPRLIEQSSQWLSGPSLLLPAAGSPADYQTGFKVCSDTLQSLFNYWYGLT